ncbi:MAG: NAD(P)H-quinone oxidoreductase [Deltaproteobacteria bacterium]|nr:NAD(P)H-quinone oxidoreductase [Deltaproteobacteria bacterium]
MKAIHVAEDHSLHWLDVERVGPAPDEVLLRVRAAGVNRLDLMQRAGTYPVPRGESQVLGVEAAGEIVAVGAAVTEWSVGDDACALLGGGGYATHVTVPADMLLPIPRGVSMEEAASLPEAYYTAYVNLVLEAGLRRRENVLVHAGGSGVGTAIVQLVRAFGAHAYATASASKLDRILTLGALGVHDRAKGEFVSWALEATQTRGMDVIIDPVGGAYVHADVRALAPGGRLVLIGLLGGTTGELPLASVLRNRLHIIGSVLRSRPREEKVAITREIRQHVWPLFDSGALRPVLEAIFPIEQAAEAHERLRAGHTFGKLVLEVP